jgi:hypothetical protein
MNTYAFPSGHDPKTGTAQFGMNLRDYFAAKAMQAMVNKCDDYSFMTKYAYEVADLMMKARDE